MKKSMLHFALNSLGPAVAVLLVATSTSYCSQIAAIASQHESKKPQNLKVLPSNLTIRQVRTIMDSWTDALGVDCDTCHVLNAKDLAPNGHPRMNYADDSKEEKKTARVMYTMVQAINANYISKIPNSGMPVGCGSCHRGHLSPEPFVPAN